MSLFVFIAVVVSLILGTVTAALIVTALSRGAIAAIAAASVPVEPGPPRCGRILGYWYDPLGPQTTVAFFVNLTDLPRPGVPIPGKEDQDWGALRCQALADSPQVDHACRQWSTSQSATPARGHAGCEPKTCWIPEDEGDPYPDLAELEGQ